MKRASLALLALGLVVLSVRPAPAWVSFNFGTGVNTGVSAGDNSLLFGLIRGGPMGYGSYGDPVNYDGHGLPGPGDDFDGYGVAVGYPVQSTMPDYPGAPVAPAQTPFDPPTHTQAGYSDFKAPDYWGR